MLLLPIGQERTHVRREPWVTWAIVALNVLVFLGIRLTANDDERQARFREKAIAIVQYLEARPYLQLSEQRQRFFTKDFLDELAIGRRELERAAGVPVPEVLVVEQERLDELFELLQEVRRSALENRLGYVPSRPSVVTLFSGLFVHGGWVHIIGNLFLLLLVGPPVEDLFGRPFFTALYLAGGVAATLTHALRLHDDTALIGASGAIAAVMGAFLVRLGTARIQFLLLPIGFLWFWRYRFWLPAFVVLPFWFLEQFVSAQIAPDEGIAWWAHIGGFTFGVAFALALRALRIEERYVDPAIEAEIGITQNPLIEAASDARAAGEYEKARAEISPVLAAEPANLDARIEAYEIAVAMQDHAEAGASAARLLDLYLRQNEQALAGNLIEDALERVGASLPARFLMTAASFLKKQGDGRAALDLYERVARDFARDPAAFRALFRRGEILRRGGDARGARLAYEQARAHPACSGPLAEAVAKALASLSG